MGKGKRRDKMANKPLNRTKKRKLKKTEEDNENDDPEVVNLTQHQQIRGNGKEFLINKEFEKWNEIMNKSMSSVNEEKELSVLLDGTEESHILLRNTAFNSFALAVEEEVVSDPDVPRENPSEKQILNRINELKEREQNQIQFSNVQKLMHDLYESKHPEDEDESLLSMQDENEDEDEEESNNGEEEEEDEDDE